MKEENNILRLLQAVDFAAKKHKNQRRKGADEQPYINHPVEVAEQIVRVGKVTDINILLTAILHDTVEDTDATPEEIEAMFGAEVREMVLEVTDDKSLPKAERKKRQVEHAPHLSAGAKHVKLSDKTSNIRDIMQNPPPFWTIERRLEYLAWGEKVVHGLRGVNTDLEKMFDEILKEAREKIATEIAEKV